MNELKFLSKCWFFILCLFPFVSYFCWLTISYQANYVMLACSAPVMLLARVPCDNNNDSFVDTLWVFAGLPVAFIKRAGTTLGKKWGTCDLRKKGNRKSHHHKISTTMSSLALAEFCILMYFRYLGVRPPILFMSQLEKQELGWMTNESFPFQIPWRTWRDNHIITCITSGHVMHWILKATYITYKTRTIKVCVLKKSSALQRDGTT